MVHHKGTSPKPIFALLKVLQFFPCNKLLFLPFNLKKVVIEYQLHTYILKGTKNLGSGSIFSFLQILKKCLDFQYIGCHFHRWKFVLYYCRPLVLCTNLSSEFSSLQSFSDCKKVASWVCTEADWLYRLVCFLMHSMVCWHQI